MVVQPVLSKISVGAGEMIHLLGGMTTGGMTAIPEAGRMIAIPPGGTMTEAGHLPGMSAIRMIGGSQTAANLSDCLHAPVRQPDVHVHHCLQGMTTEIAVHPCLQGMTIGIAGILKTENAAVLMMTETAQIHQKKTGGQSVKIRHHPQEVNPSFWLESCLTAASHCSQCWMWALRSTE